MKIGIITINDNDNYGNRLQNYAVQEILNSMNVKVITLKNEAILNSKNLFILRLFKCLIYKIKSSIFKKRKRFKKFKEFNKNIKFSRFFITPYTRISEKYDFFVAGSDQIWKPTYGRLRDVDLLNFAKDCQKIAFSASFGISKLPNNKKVYAKKYLEKFKIISVREDSGKKIVEELTGRDDIEVLVDPTMLLSADEWNKVSKRPKQLDTLKSNKYILNYFLGNCVEEYKNEIDRIAKENNCEIINILDKNNPFYCTGPSEFLYLAKNAFLVCTDSFHSLVFSILYNTPFVAFERKDERVSMNSRIDTLLQKFNLEERRFTGKIEKEQLDIDCSNTYKILEEERKKSIQFLEKALDIKEN